jgi:hypothetical protein
MMVRLQVELCYLRSALEGLEQSIIDRAAQPAECQVLAASSSSAAAAKAAAAAAVAVAEAAASPAELRPAALTAPVGVPGTIGSVPLLQAAFAAPVAVPVAASFISPLQAVAYTGIGGADAPGFQAELYGMLARIEKLVQSSKAADTEPQGCRSSRAVPSFSNQVGVNCLRQVEPDATPSFLQSPLAVSSSHVHVASAHAPAMAPVTLQPLSRLDVGAGIGHQMENVGTDGEGARRLGRLLDDLDTVNNQLDRQRRSMSAKILAPDKCNESRCDAIQLLATWG